MTDKINGNGSRAAQEIIGDFAELLDRRQLEDGSFGYCGADMFPFARKIDAIIAEAEDRATKAERRRIALILKGHI